MMIKVHSLNHTTFTALLGGHLLLLLRPSRQSYTPLQSCYIHLWVHMFVHSLQQKSESWTLFSMIDIMSSSTHGVVHSELTELFYFRSANQIYNINSQGYRYHDMTWHDLTYHLCPIGLSGWRALEWRMCSTGYYMWRQRGQYTACHGTGYRQQVSEDNVTCEMDLIEKHPDMQYDR